MYEHPFIVSAKNRKEFPSVWRGFDLSSMNENDKFAGCVPCGTQTMAISFDEVLLITCPQCREYMQLFCVSHADVEAKKHYPYQNKDDFTPITNEGI